MRTSENAILARFTKGGDLYHFRHAFQRLSPKARRVVVEMIGKGVEPAAALKSAKSGQPGLFY